MDAPLNTAQTSDSAPETSEAAGGVSRRGRRKSILPNRTNGGKRVFIRVLPDEHAAIAERAAEAGLTVSEFIRRIAMGYKTQSRFDYDVMEYLIKMHTDMNRLGNLFKLSLKQSDGAGEISAPLLSEREREWHRSILKSIEENQELLRNYIGGFNT